MAVASGDRSVKPILVCEPHAEADGICPSSSSFQHEVTGDQAVMVRVVSPYGRAAAQGIDLNQLLHDDPETGNAKLAEFTEAARAEAKDALAAGADGICYEVEGASPSDCSPMQFGGYYLEVDRALMEEISDAPLNVLWIKSTKDAYLDFVCDIPAAIFAWSDPERRPSEVRDIRPGCLAACSPDADVIFSEKYDQMEAAS
jgi:hypothetical protein